MTDPLPASAACIPKGRARGRARGMPKPQTDTVDVAPKPGSQELDDPKIKYDEETPSLVATHVARYVSTVSTVKRTPRTVAEHLEAYMVALSAEYMSGELSWQANTVLEEHLNTKPSSCREKRGETGRNIRCVTNFLPIVANPGWTLCRYKVTFEPDVCSKSLQLKLLNQHQEIFGKELIFHGNFLYLPRRLNNDSIVVSSFNAKTDENIQILVRFESQTTPHSPEFFYSILSTRMNKFSRVFSALDFSFLGKHFYNPKAGILIDKHNIEVWPGVFSSIRSHEESLLMCTEISHKLLKIDTVLDFLYELFDRTGGERYYEKATHMLIGATVITRYNNRLYKIDDIMWKKKVTDVFTMPDGSKMTYFDYYKTRYNKKISDIDQPLLLSRLRRQSVAKGIAKSLDCFLVPELCTMVGLTEELRDDRRAMATLGQFTRIPPFRRIDNARMYLQNMKQNERVLEMYNRWGLSFAGDVLEISARILPAEQLQCGNRIINYSPDVADWSRESRGASITDAKAMDDWIFLFTNSDRDNAQSFYKTLCKVGPPMGMEIREPNIIQLESDRINDYLSAIKYALEKFSQTRIVVVIVPNDNKTRYDAIKKLCCVENPVPSQVVNSSKSLKNRKNLMTIVTKIAMQINVKMDGGLWHVQVPMRSVMIIGYDTYYDSQYKGKSFGVAVFSMDENLTKWHSQCAMHEDPKEMIDNLILFFKNGFKKFHERNGTLPERVVFFRDGVAEGMTPVVYLHELPRIKEVFQHFAIDYKPKLTFCIVQKKISARFFEITSSGEIDNPTPGTVVDSAITKPNRYDFYLVPQSVRQGTVTPVSYNVIYDDSGLKPDYMQRFCFKMCHMYYNWQGTIRVPSACQYAHKLAMLGGQSLHRAPHESLQDRLFFL